MTKLNLSATSSQNSKSTAFSGVIGCRKLKFEVLLQEYDPFWSQQGKDLQKFCGACFGLGKGKNKTSFYCSLRK